MNRKEKAHIILVELKRLFPSASILLHFSNPWELLVAVILSAQCTDRQVNKVTPALFKKYKTVTEYAHMDVNELERYIFSTGFYRAKAAHIIASAQMICKKFGGNVPRTMREMIQLPGVGRKTANVVLGNAYGVIEGIAVDTHVMRISRVYGLTRHRDPIHIERDLMRIIPRSEWLSTTYRIIEYGRTYCPARKHDHSTCPLSLVLQAQKRN